MAVKIRRSYKGAAVSAVLDSSGVTSATQTAITLSTSPSTWPTGKFFVVVAPGTAQEEKMCVTVSGSTLTVVDPAVSSTSASANGRGVDNTTARSTIAGGATVYPVFTAVDADEANELTSTYANQGGIVYQGASTFAQLAIGTAGQVLKVNSGATAPEWGQVATAGIADSAVTSAKIADGTIVAGDIADSTITLAKLAPAATPGMVHINTTTISGANATVISNIFSSTYSSYRIVVSNLTVNSGTAACILRLAASGTADTDSNYSQTVTAVYTDGTSSSSGLTSQGYWLLSDLNDARKQFVEIDLDGPNLAQATTGIYRMVMGNSISYGFWQGALINSESTQYGGLQLAGATGANISCTVTVYGYVK